MEIKGTIFFRGRVQGVGFRQTVLELSDDFRVNGYVKNLPDGSVEVVMEGEEKELQQFLAAIRESRLSNYILDYQAEWGKVTGAFNDFEIRY